MKNKQESTLIEAFKQMSDKDRLWLLALSASCVNRKDKTMNEALIFMRLSEPGK